MSRFAFLRRFLGFFAGSAIGLAIDTGGFALLGALGVAAGLANAVSSGTSVVVVYLLVTRYAFGDRLRAVTFVLFVGWYAFNIVTVSVCIGLLTEAHGAPFFWKICSIPVSFAANYLFSTVLFRHAELAARLRRAAGGKRLLAQR